MAPTKYMLAMACMLLLTFSAHNSFALATQGPFVPEWTVLVYINGANNALEEAAECTFYQMLAAKLNRNVEVFVELSFTGFDQLASANTVPARCLNSTTHPVPYWQGTRRFTINDHQVKDYEVPQHPKMTSAEAFQEFLSWAAVKSHSRRYILILWGHGDANPSFEAKSVDSPSVMNVKSLFQDKIRVHADNDSPLFGAYREKGIALLLNKDIAEAVKDTFKGRRFDIIGFDECYKGMVETAYVMKEFANVFVASEAAEPPFGWDYSDVLSKLASRPQMATAAAGSMLVSSFRAENAAIVPGWATLSATRMKRLLNVTSAIDRVATVLLKDPRRFTIVHKVRCQIPDYQFNQIDLGLFAALLLRYSKNDAALHSAALGLHTSVSRMIIQPPYAGKDSRENYGSTGIAIYFPASRAEYDSDPDKSAYDIKGPDAIPFVVDHKIWAKFLMKYLDLISHSANLLN